MALAAVGGQVFRSEPKAEATKQEISTHHSADTAKIDYRQIVGGVKARFHGTHKSSKEVVVAPLIVMVADPVDTGLDWAHDQHMKAVRRAYEAAGFTLVHHAVPWRPGAKGPTRSSEGPGFLVFNSQDPACIAPVFLVPESPTSGLTAAAAAALQTALQQERILANPIGPLRVVGPIFSGTRHALIHGLGAGCQGSQLRQSRQVRVISGSATISSLLKDMQDEAKMWGTLDLKVSSTLMNDGDYEKAIEAIARRLGYEPHECALISERSTQYSQGVAKSLTPDGAIRSRKDSFYKGCLSLTFPSHITHLRAEYSARWQQERPHGQDFHPIGLGLLDASNDALAPPPVSILTDAVVDQRLTSILQKLRASGAKMAILVATDVRDKILLGREIARHVPDLQLVTTESNLLYLRRELASAQRGMLVVGSTALVPGLGSDRDGEHMQAFASDAEVGVCAAVLQQISESNANPEGGDYASLKKATGIEPWLGEAVCLTCVGATQMLPLRIQRKDGVAAVRQPLDCKKVRDDYGSFALLLIGLAFSCGSMWAIRRDILWRDLNIHLAYARPRFVHSTATTNIWLITFAMCSFGTTMACYGFSLTLYDHHPNGWMIPLIAGSSLMHFMWLLRVFVPRGSSVHAFTILAEHFRISASNPTNILAPICIAILSMLLLLTGLETTRSHQDVWALQRIGSFFEMVSPIAPALAMGCILSYWSIVQMRRYRRCHGELPYECEDTPPPSTHPLGIAPPLDARKIIAGMRMGQPLSFCVSCLVVLLFSFCLREHTTIEAIAQEPTLSFLQDPFGAFYRFGFLFLMIAIVVGCGRLIAAWNVLSGHMRRLDDPIRSALRRKAEDPEPTVDTDLAATPLPVRRPFELRRAWVAVLEWSSKQGPSRIHLLTSQRPSISRRIQLLTLLGNMHPRHAHPKSLDAAANLDPAIADYIATEFCIWLRWVLGQIQKLAKNLMLILIASSLILWAYPLHPQSTQTTPYLVASLSLILTLLYLIIAMSANPVLSILTKTEPGHVTFNRAFVNSFFVYIALPGLAFVAAQMPEFGAQLLGWVQPLLSAATTR